MSSGEARANTTIKRVRGYPVPVHFSDQHVEEALDHVPRDGDVIVASYPKTGTIWMQFVVMQVVSKGEKYSTDLVDFSLKVAPFLEMTGCAALDALPEPRVYRYHKRYDAANANDKSKVCYIYRHPDDTFVSLFNFLNGFRPGFMSFDECFEFFMSGDINCGCYFKHVLSYFRHQQDTNLLLVSYEAMKKDPKTEILRIAEFTGEEYRSYLVKNESALESILEKTSFDYMKKNVGAHHPLKSEEKFHFFRKGGVGDGKKCLSEEQRRRIREKAEKILKGTPVLKTWYGLPGEK